MKVEAEGADGVNEIRFNMPSRRSLKGVCKPICAHVDTSTLFIWIHTDTCACSHTTLVHSLILSLDV